jgi:RNA polymerase sigma-70 factor (ECF subfamily)
LILKAHHLHPDEIKYEESKLISLLAEDSEYAFQLLYDRHRKRIYQTALRYLKSPILAQEVVQDVFLKLWFNRKSLKPDQPLEAWLYSLTKNNLINRLKKIANEWKALKGLGFISERSINNIENNLQESQYNELLQTAIGQLSEQQQKVFTLARHEQLTYLEIGKKLQISPLTVKTHMSRALESIKVFFSDHGITLSTSIIILLF